MAAAADTSSPEPGVLPGQTVSVEQKAEGAGSGTSSPVTPSANSVAAAGASSTQGFVDDDLRSQVVKLRADVDRLSARVAAMSPVAVRDGAPAGQAVAASTSGTLSPNALDLPPSDSRAYASGVSVGRSLLQSLAVQRSLGLTLTKEQVLAGIEDVFNQKTLRMQNDDIQTTLTQLNEDFTGRQRQHIDAAKAQGQAFRETFRKRKGVTQDAGFLYQVLDRGTGHLSANDMATLEMTGRLPDGTLFDDSGKAGQSRRVRVGAMLPALAIGLQKVGVGGHIVVVIPPEKGYGDIGVPPDIPGGATLIFDITVKGGNDPSKGENEEH
jgi:FKBP-type peptidyl-prolyl cis-trans isomerase